MLTRVARPLGAPSIGFLQDEVEGLDRRDSLYGGAVAVVFLIVPIVVIPNMTSTIVSAWRQVRCRGATLTGARRRRTRIGRYHSVNPATNSAGSGW